MATFAWIVMTDEEAAAATAFNTPDATIAPMTIDNPLADNLGYGALVGKKVVPARLLNDPPYAPFWSTLGTLPIHVMDSDTLFLPIPEDA